MSMTMKQLRAAAETALESGVTNRAALLSAVPLLVEFQESIEGASKHLKRCKELAAGLSDACAAYAVTNTKVFDDGLNLISKGVKNGDLTINDETYHFTSGYGPLKRLDGDVLSQDFLNDLPAGWTKLEMKLDTTGINRLKVDEAELEKNGLYRPEKFSWS